MAETSAHTKNVAYGTLCARKDWALGMNKQNDTADCEIMSHYEAAHSRWQFIEAGTARGSQPDSKIHSSVLVARSDCAATRGRRLHV
jgi:hypothetical protein